MAPLTINHASIPAGDANTDTLLVVAGSSNGSPEGDGIVRQTTTNVYSVMTPTSFSVDDWVVAQAQNRPATCSLRLDPVLAVNGTNPPDVTVRTGVTGMTNGRLYNLGKTPRLQAYAVRGGNLTVCDLLVSDCTSTARLNDEAVWTPVAGSVVSLRAQYGRDTSGPPMDAVPDVYDQTAPVAACDWARVAAVRLALVTRNDQYEKTEVTAAAPAWSGGSDLPIDLSDGADWRHYRYKLFQTIVPIRNIVVLGARTAC
jgi:type IV pilus assembly protein PilW